MLIVIAGIIGAGKTTIARDLSKLMKIPLYSIDDDKKHIYLSYPKYDYNIKNNIPFPDYIRKKAFTAALEGLRKLAVRYKHAIVEETFHKRKIREPFFCQAKKIFGDIILVEVKLPDDLVKKRLENRSKEEQHMVGYGMYLSFKKQWEPFDKVDYIFRNEGDYERNLRDCIAFLKEKITESPQ